MRTFFSVIAILAVIAATPADARDSRLPVPRPAPAWDVVEWINSDDMALSDLKGQVVIVEFFQLWCPGCNRFSIPLIKEWEKKFAKQIRDKNLTIVSIHTVFEGHSYQNAKKLKRFLKSKGITHPVGVDRHREGDHIPQTMRNFVTSGTPEIAVVDKEGIIRMQQFGGFNTRAAERLIRNLLSR